MTIFIANRYLLKKKHNFALNNEFIPFKWLTWLCLPKLIPFESLIALYEKLKREKSKKYYPIPILKLYFCKMLLNFKNNLLYQKSTSNVKLVPNFISLIYRYLFIRNFMKLQTYLGQSKCSSLLTLLGWH